MYVALALFVVAAMAMHDMLCSGCHALCAPNDLDIRSVCFSPAKDRRAAPATATCLPSQQVAVTASLARPTMSCRPTLPNSCQQLLRHTPRSVTLDDPDALRTCPRVVQQLLRRRADSLGPGQIPRVWPALDGGVEFDKHRPTVVGSVLILADSGQIQF